MKNVTATTFVLLALAGSGSANALTVDGSLADWGILQNGQASGLKPSAGIAYTLEDQSSSYLGPGYGGQAYDAEALYTTFSGGKLYIAMATGHNPLTVNNPGGNVYGPGDFAIDFGKNGTYELGINMKHKIDSTTYESFGVLGGVYSPSTWALGLWNSAGAYDPAHADPTHPTYMTSGTYLGTADFTYTTSGATGYGNLGGTHYFYEMSVDTSLLLAAGWDGTSSFNIHWTEICANDNIVVSTNAYVPEPGTLWISSLALLTLGLARRRPAVGCTGATA